MGIHSTVSITRQDAIELIRRKINESDFLECIPDSWIDNILYAITDHEANPKESRYFNYAIVSDYRGTRYYLDADETMTNMYEDNKHLF